MSWEDRPDDYWCTVQVDVSWHPNDNAAGGDYEPHGIPSGYERVTPWKPLTAVATGEGQAPTVVWTACYRRKASELELLAASGELSDKELIEMLFGAVRRLTKEKR